MKVKDEEETSEERKERTETGRGRESTEAGADANVEESE